jgi:hypothetical protein
MLKTFAAALLVSATLAAVPAVAQEAEHRGPILVAPVNGTTVGNPVTIALGFTGGEGHAHPPADRDHEGGEHRGHGGGHFFVFIDTAPPEPGATVAADATHVPFPEGQRQLTLTLPAGPHRLALVGVNREGEVSRRIQGAEPLSIIVQ